MKTPTFTQAKSIEELLASDDPADEALLAWVWKELEVGQ